MNSSALSFLSVILGYDFLFSLPANHQEKTRKRLRKEEKSVLSNLENYDLLYIQLFSIMGSDLLFSMLVNHQEKRRKRLRKEGKAIISVVEADKLYTKLFLIIGYDLPFSPAG